MNDLFKVTLILLTLLFVCPSCDDEKDPEPEPGPLCTFSFYVEEINNGFNEEPDPGVVSSAGATITLWKEADGKQTQLGTIKTDSEGFAGWETREEGSILYTVRKGEASPFAAGYRIVGLVTKQEQIDEGPFFSTGTKLDDRYIGALLVRDTNGDGVIDEDDKVSSELIGAIPDDMMNSVIIGSL